MNSLQARFILEACRSGQDDASDPKMIEAQQAMESDPELAQWFAASQELDRSIIAKLKAVPVPDDLRERIQAGESCPAPTDPPQSRKAWLQLAALVAILAVLALFMLPRTPVSDLATFRQDMVEFLDHDWDRTFDHADPDYAQLKLWLEGGSNPLEVDLPHRLATSRTIGCKALHWHGTTATLICFLPQNAGTAVHVFVVDLAALAERPGDAPKLARLAHWNSATWTRGNKLYLALTTASLDQLRACL